MEYGTIPEIENRRAHTSNAMQNNTAETGIPIAAFSDLMEMTAKSIDAPNQVSVIINQATEYLPRTSGELLVCISSGIPINKDTIATHVTTPQQ